MRFFKDLRKYINYAMYSAAAELKNQVHGSYLGWLWWVLDPLLYMLVYSFIVNNIFGTKVENLPLFVFVGLTVWNFFASTVQSSVGCIRSYRSVLQKSYLPKFILVLLIEFANFFKMLIGLCLSLAAMAVLGVPIRISILGAVPLLICHFAFVFGLSLISAHIGVYIVDFQNVMAVLIRLLFYLSGVFYELDRLPPWMRGVYDKLNPTGFMINQFRECFLYGGAPNWLLLLYWLLIAVALSVVGLMLTYRHENNYMKVV